MILKILRSWPHNKYHHYANGDIFVVNLYSLSIPVDDDTCQTLWCNTCQTTGSQHNREINYKHFYNQWKSFFIQFNFFCRLVPQEPCISGRQCCVCFYSAPARPPCWITWEVSMCRFRGREGHDLHPTIQQLRAGALHTRRWWPDLWEAGHSRHHQVLPHQKVSVSTNRSKTMFYRCLSVFLSGGGWRGVVSVADRLVPWSPLPGFATEFPFTLFLSVPQ